MNLFERLKSHRVGRTGSSAANAPTLAPSTSFPHSHYTYFIVPFSYQRRRQRNWIHKPKAGTPYFRPLKEAATYNPLIDGDPPTTVTLSSEARWQARRQYPLPETRLGLFERASWFQLEKDGAPLLFSADLTAPGSASTPSSGVTIPFSAGPIQLVLFEWNCGPSRPNVTTPIGTIGFLLLSTVLEERANLPSPSLDSLLDLNLLLRYLEPPVAGSYRSRLTFQVPDPDVQRFEADTDSPSRYWPFWMSLLNYSIQWGEAWYQLAVDDYPSPAQLAEDVSAQFPRGKRAKPGYPDDRAFTYTFACVKGIPPLLGLPNREKGERYGYERLWYALLDVDGADMLQDTPTNELSPVELNWLRDHSYERWLHRDTLYGYTTFSAALLVRHPDQGSPFPDLYYHFHTLYLDFLLLLLYQRVALLRLSHTFTLLSAEYSHQPEAHHLDQFRALRRQFTLLTNLYRFPIFTSQYQGQELYELARRGLDIDHLYEQVGKEVHATDALITQTAQEQIASGLNRLQWVGLGIALLALFMTAFSLTLATLQILDPLSDTTLSWLEPWRSVFEDPVRGYGILWSGFLVMAACFALYGLVQFPTWIRQVASWAKRLPTHAGRNWSRFQRWWEMRDIL